MRGPAGRAAAREFAPKKLEKNGAIFRVIRAKIITPARICCVDSLIHQTE
jgi:hypothetical protein